MCLFSDCFQGCKNIFSDNLRKDLLLKLFVLFPLEFWCAEETDFFGDLWIRLGVPWTEKEHKLFLLGLEKVGKGDWRGISRNYVKTRTPTQVASHAQKHFLRRNNLNRRRRRSSLFDITTDSVTSFLNINTIDFSK